jgi:hypothetical protein
MTKVNDCIVIQPGTQTGSLRWFRSHLWVAKRETYNEHHPDVVSFTNALDDVIVFTERGCNACWLHTPELSSVSRLGGTLAFELEEWIDDHIDELTTDDLPVEAEGL